MKRHKLFIEAGKRFTSDLLDPLERQYWGYHCISQIPGLTGNMLRGYYIAKHCRYSGENLQVLAGARFRSLENLEVGDGVVIGYDNFIQSLGGVTIGDHVMLGPGVKIWSVNHGYKDREIPVKDQKQNLSSVSIGNDVWIAANVFLCPGVILPDGVVASAGSVVCGKEYKPYSILAGNPARVIGFRE